jgi:hypothetical protein
MQANNLTIEQLYNIFSTHAAMINPFGATIQCILESSLNGLPFNSGLAIQANNLAGMKATRKWTGKTVDKQTWEQRPDGTRYQVVAKWRAWDSVEAFTLTYSKTIHTSYPLCATDNFMGYFSGLLKGKLGAWATDTAYFTKLLTIAWANSPIFFGRPSEKWKLVLIDASDRKLFTIPEHEKLAVEFMKVHVS